MRHRHSGRQLGVTPDHRRALLRNLTIALIEKEAIQTIPSRAKELRWFADRVITWAKQGDVAGRRQIIQLLGSSQNTGNGGNRIRNAIDKIYSDYVPRFKTRNGGYTQIFLLAKRRPGDNAEQCLMRYIPDESGSKKSAPKKSDKAGKKEAKAPKKELKAKAPEAAKEKKAAKEPEDKPTKAKKKDK